MLSNKNPFTAAVINFFFWGLGYVYLGKRIIFGHLVFLGFLFIHLPLFYGVNWLEIPGVFILVGHLVISFAFAFDIIELAKVKSPKKEWLKQTEKEIYAS